MMRKLTKEDVDDDEEDDAADKTRSSLIAIVGSS